MSKSANSYFQSMPPLLVVWLAASLTSACTGGTRQPQSVGGGPIEHQLIAEIALQRGQYQVSLQEYLSLAQKSSNPEHARRTTELAYEYEFDAYALAGAERWAELAPEDPRAQAYLGRMYVRSNQLDKAFASLDAGLGPVAERTDADYMVLSAELGAAVAASRSLPLFYEFDRAYPETPGILGGLAALEAQAGNYGAAVEAAREWLQLSPEWGIARIWLARFLLANGDKSSAFEQLSFALEMNPGLELELEFVQLLVTADELEEANERLDRLSDRYPDNPDLISVRGKLALERGDYSAADTDFSYLVAEAYFVNESFWYLGQIAFQREDYPLAIRYFQLVGHGAWLTAASEATSQAFLAMGNPTAALAIQQEFAHQYPKQHINVLRRQAEILVETGRPEEAVAAIDTAIEFKPWDEGLWVYRGGLLEQAGQLDESVESFRQALILAPNSALILNALGYTMTIAGQDYAEAAEYIYRANSLDPENPAVMDSLGWVLYQRGEPEEALQWLERAFELLPDPEIAAHLGEVLWVSGEREVAARVWAEALIQGPDNVVLLSTMDRFLK